MSQKPKLEIITETSLDSMTYGSAHKKRQEYFVPPSPLIAT